MEDFQLLRRFWSRTLTLTISQRWRHRYSRPALAANCNSGQRGKINHANIRDRFRVDSDGPSYTTCIVHGRIQGGGVTRVTSHPLRESKRKSGNLVSLSCTVIISNFLCGLEISTVVYVQTSLARSNKKAQRTKGLRATAPSFQDGLQPPSWILSNRK